MNCSKLKIPVSLYKKIIRIFIYVYYIYLKHTYECIYCYKYIQYYNLYIFKGNFLFV